MLKLFNENILVQRVYTFEASWSTLSATFPTDKRISVLCCRASVIKKEVTSLEPGEINTTTKITGFGICNSFTNWIKCKTALQLCSIINYWSCCCERTASLNGKMDPKVQAVSAVLYKCQELSWFDHNGFFIIDLTALTHVWDSLCRIDLANRLQMRWSHRGRSVVVRLWNKIMHWYKEILLLTDDNLVQHVMKSHLKGMGAAWQPRLWGNSGHNRK